MFFQGSPEDRLTTSDANPLGVTALYTSQAWIQGGLPEATLFDTRTGRAVYHATTSVYRLARWLRPGMAPLLAGLLHRHLMIDHLLEAQDPGQVLELAAGLSARGARHTAGDLLYTEVDLPLVMDAKQRLLRRSPRGRDIAARPNLRLVAADVTRLDMGALLDPALRAFVIAEGLHMYLDVATQRRLWRTVADGLGRGAGGAFAFDHFRRAASQRPGPVSNAVLRTMRTWQRRIGFRPDRRSRKALVRDLCAAGFDRVEAFHSRDVARDWGLPQADAPTDAVLFLAHREGAAR
jgi:O-methyltransferase involved in polyketide biosynthesis